MQLISPLMKVLEIAPANVWHGAVRLHGLASLPPDPVTQVRVAWAWPGAAYRLMASAAPKPVASLFILISMGFVTLRTADCGCRPAIGARQPPAPVTVDPSARQPAHPATNRGSGGLRAP